MVQRAERACPGRGGRGRGVGHGADDVAFADGAGPSPSG